MEPLRLSDFERMDFDSLCQHFPASLNRMPEPPLLLEATGGSSFREPRRVIAPILPAIDEFETESVRSPLLGGLFMQIMGRPPRSFRSPAELQTMLLQESEPNWTPARTTDILSLPVTTITSQLLNQTDNKMCSVCQEDYNLGEQVNVLPCQHLFHQQCIKTWLEQNRVCPLCRKEVNNNSATSAIPSYPTLSSSSLPTSTLFSRGLSPGITTYPTAWATSPSSDSPAITPIPAPSLYSGQRLAYTPSEYTPSNLSTYYTHSTTPSAGYRSGGAPVSYHHPFDEELYYRRPATMCSSAAARGYSWPSPVAYQAVPIHY